MWLADESMIEVDGGEAYINNFGVIAAARDLEQFDELVRKQVRFVRYQGFNKIAEIGEQRGRSGSAVGFES